MHDLLEILEEHLAVVNRFPSCKPRGRLAVRPRKKPLKKQAIFSKQRNNL